MRSDHGIINGLAGRSGRNYLGNCRSRVVGADFALSLVAPLRNLTAVSATSEKSPLCHRGDGGAGAWAGATPGLGGTDLSVRRPNPPDGVAPAHAQHVTTDGHDTANFPGIQEEP